MTMDIKKQTNKQKKKKTGNHIYIKQNGKWLSNKWSHEESNPVQRGENHGP